MKLVRHFAYRRLIFLGAVTLLFSTTVVKPGQSTAQEADAPSRDVAADEKPAEQAWGNLKGRFIYDGEPPVPVKVNVTTDRETYGKLNIVDESLVVAKDRSLANVVVWVRNKNVPIHNSYDALKKLETDIQVFNGRFEPHITPYWTGQPLRLRNLDPVATNINSAFIVNAPFNSLLPQRGAQQIRPLTEAEVTPVCLSDNIHPWPKGWLVVQPHPYVAVSDADGRFELKNLPAGMPLEFQVWQETAGYVQKAQIAGQDAGWAKGRFTLTLKPDENHDLGDIKLDPQQFNKGAAVRAGGPLAQQNAAALAGGLAPRFAAQAVAAPAVAVLGKGDKFKLEAGKLTVKSAGVGQMLLEGPATVALVDEQRLKLSQGRVKLRITEPAGHDFVIETPHGQVGELGTETTVSVDEAGKADVVIRDGKVEVVALPKKENPPEAKTEVAAPAAETPAQQADIKANGESNVPEGRGNLPTRAREADRSGRSSFGRGSFGGTATGRGDFRSAPSERQAQEQTKLEKLLVGTWRGGHSDGTLRFHEGGIFEELSRTLTGPQQDANDIVQGRWSVDRTGTGRSSIRIQVDLPNASLRGLPTIPERRSREERFIIVRLDEKMLRLDIRGGRGVNAIEPALFFHRVENHADVDERSAELPDAIRRLKYLADLPSEDAIALAAPKINWLKQWDVSDAQLALIEKVAKARHGEIDLAELFDLSKEDADAFSELYSMTNGNFKAIRELADKEHLTPAELATVKKLSAAKDEFERGIGAMKAGIAKITQAEREALPPTERKTAEALEKLSAALDLLWNFPNATVFAEPPEQQANPRGGFRGGGGRFREAEGRAAAERQ